MEYDFEELATEEETKEPRSLVVPLQVVGSRKK
jgi:hypothetical protein